MAKKSNKIDPLNPKPLGTEFKKPEGRKKPLDPVPMPGNEEPELGFGDYLRLGNRLFVNWLASIMGLEESKANDVKWIGIALVAIALVILLIKVF